MMIKSCLSAQYKKLQLKNKWSNKIFLVVTLFFSKKVPSFRTIIHFFEKYILHPG